MIDVTIQGKQKISLRETQEGIALNEVLSHHHIVPVSPTQFKVFGEKSIYDVELISTEKKKITISINNQLIETEVVDHIDQILKKLGMDSTSVKSIKEVKAPMPGTILELMVKEGDQVKAGDPMLVLEAMKMENVIKSSGDGTVSKIEVSPGNNVEKNQVLISFS